MSSKNIADAHPILQIYWPEIKAKFMEKTGNDLVLTCTWRSVEEQKELYAQGRSKPGQIVTWVDGEKKFSNHNLKPAKAIDVAVVDKNTKKITWNEDLYKPLGPVVSSFGLAWGGYWKTPDYPHIELIVSD